MSNNVHILKHPLISHKLSKIRDEKTNTKEFNETVNEIGALLTYEITRDLKTRKVKIKTPVSETEGEELAEPVVLVPILRAGLGMIDGIRNLIPTAKVGIIGLYRDEKTLNVHKYYAKFPEATKNSVVILIDPMLATGNTAKAAVKMLKEAGAEKIKYVGLVGCPEGVENLQKKYPDVEIYLAALDERLNKKGYIVPGLGDCGDRLFGTK